MTEQEQAAAVQSARSSRRFALRMTAQSALGIVLVGSGLYLQWGMGVAMLVSGAMLWGECLIGGILLIGQTRRSQA